MAFLKAFFTTLLFLFTLTVLTIMAAIYLIKFQPESYLGAKIRDKAIHSPQFVNFINLDQPGDLRYHYIDPAHPTLSAIVYSNRAYPADQNINQWLENMVDESLGKNLTITTQPNAPIPQQTDYTMQDLNDIREKLIANQSKPATPHFNLIYLSTYREEPGYAGIVLHHDTIFLFKNTINELNSSPNIRNRIERSTLMHEWGHLLGLDHLDKDHCIMSESVEVYSNRTFQNFNIPTEFCFETIATLEGIKRNF